MDIYEYGIWNVKFKEIHRIGLTQEEAVKWVDEWLEDGGLGSAFTIVRRPTPEWEIW